MQKDGVSFMSKAKKSTVPAPAGLTFEHLVLSIRGIDSEMAAQAGRGVNVSLTFAIGSLAAISLNTNCVAQDRAQYGEKLLANLAVRLAGFDVQPAEERELRRYRRFYQTYPQIRESVTPELRKNLALPAIGSRDPIREPVTPESRLSGKELITKLSFTHIAELLAIQDASTLLLRNRVHPRQWGSA